MAIPAFRALGTFASGTTSCTPGLPAGHTTDDILILIVECDDSETPNTPTDWTSLGSANDGADVKLTVFIKRHDGSEVAPTVDGTSNHVHAWIGAYSGVDPSGSPWLLGSFYTAGGATITYPGITTTVADALVLLLTAIGDNANDTENLSGYTNANLSDLTDRDDEAETTGTGGGLGFADGGKASTGATGDSTCTHDNAVGGVAVHLALYPAASGATTLTADSGSYSITGTAAGLDTKMPADAGSYAVTGTAAGTVHGYKLTADSGAYSLLGIAIGFGEFAQWLGLSYGEVETPDDSATVFMPSCQTYGDYQLLMIETDDVAVTLTTANGFTEHPGSPVSVPNADTTIRTRLTLFERIWNGSDGAPTVSSPGSDHIIGRLFHFRARHDRRRGWADLSEARSAENGTGWSAVSEATQDTSGSHDSVTTDEPDQLIIGIIATARPPTTQGGLGGANQLSAITNANLANITERYDIALDGNGFTNGGGLGIWTGEFGLQGEQVPPNPDIPIGPTTFTWATASYKASFIIALRSGGHDETPVILNCSGPTHGIFAGVLYIISDGGAVLKINAGTIDSGVYGVTGTDATLIGPAAGATLTADPGAYAATGSVADFDVVMPVASDSYGVSGTDATLIFRDLVLNADSGSGVDAYAITGAAATFTFVPAAGGAEVDTRNWLLQRQPNPHWRFLISYRQKYRRGGGIGGIH